MEPQRQTRDEQSPNPSLRGSGSREARCANDFRRAPTCRAVERIALQHWEGYESAFWRRTLPMRAPLLTSESTAVGRKGHIPNNLRMAPVRPRLTAMSTAVAVARQQMAPPRIFTDTLIIRLLRAPLAELAEPTDPLEQQLQFFRAARCRFAEDVIVEAVFSGATQVVLLGAGLGTFAYRNPFPGVRVFELDDPATQTWKRARLAESGIRVPDSVTYVPTDVRNTDVLRSLAAAGFDRRAPACFIALGVVGYISRSMLGILLHRIAQHRAPTHMVLDYREPIPSLPLERSDALKRRARVTADAGEPWLTYCLPDDIVGELTSLGFSDIESQNGMELLLRYAGPPQPDTLTVNHVLRARSPLRGQLANSRPR